MGNLKKWKEGPLVIDFEYEGRAERMLAWREGEGGREQIVRFEWTADLTFGQLLEHLGRIPIPPYLNRESQEIDNTVTRPSIRNSKVPWPLRRPACTSHRS